MKNNINKVSKKRGVFYSIRRRMLFSFGLLLVATLAIVEFLYLYGVPFTPYKGEFSNEKSRVFQNLEIVADLKKERLQRWIKERKDDTLVLSESYIMKSFIKNYQLMIQNDSTNNGVSSTLLAELKKDKIYLNLISYMNLIQKTYGVYSSIHILDAATGIVIASTNEKEFGMDMSNEEGFMGALISDDIFIAIEKGIHKYGEEFIEEEIDFHTSVRLRDSNTLSKNREGAIAVLMMHLNPDDMIKPMLHTGGGVGNTGEVVLVNRETKILTSLKYLLPDGTKPEPLEFKINTLPAVLASGSKEGVIETEDYRGEPVLAAYRYINISPGKGWGIVVKRDRAEVFAYLYNNIIFLSFAGSFVVLFALLAAYIISKSISQPVQSLNEAALKVRDGDFNARADESSGGEIGILSLTFNSMVERLKNWKTELEEEVKTRSNSLNELNIELNKEIEERERIQEELLKSQKLESVGTLAGGIAHDFNNFLASILLLSNTAKLTSEKDSETNKILDEIENSINNAKHLTQQLLTFSKGGLPVKKKLLLSPLIHDSAMLALSGSNVRSEFMIADNLWSVEADEGQINQVIGSLVINADQAMPKGGVIKLSADNVKVKAREIPPLQEGGYVLIRVVDSGTGIAEDNLQKVFDPFFTTKQKGSGLGLTAAYSIVKNHGGTIMVESELNSGTVFSIYLPSFSIYPSAAEKQIKKPVEAEENLIAGKGNILVMDDNEMVLKGCRKLLSAIGYEVDLAEEGKEAIEKYIKAKKSGKPFNVLILDLTIPGGMGGEETIKRLFEIDPEVKAIVSSGYADNPVMSDHRRYGFKTVLAKPYNAKKMSRAVHDVMAGIYD